MLFPMPDARKTAEDIEIEERVRAWIRYEITDRGISQNEMERRLGLAEGTLSKILSGLRGFSPGLLLVIRRKLGIRAAQLLDENPGAAEGPSGPQAASRATAQPGKRKAGGRG